MCTTHRRLLASPLAIAVLVLTSCDGGIDVDDEAIGENPQAVVATGPPGTYQSVLITRETRWEYHDTGTSPFPAFHNYLQCCWPHGDGPLGYGEPYIETPVAFGPDAGNKHVTTYFRTTFGRDASLRKLYLRVMYDDGFVFYINGHEGGRASMPSGAITPSTLASGHEANREYRTFDISAQIPDLIGPGQANTIVFEVHQASRSSSDLVFDAELIGWFDRPAPDYGNPLNTVPDRWYWDFWDGGGNLGTAWRQPAFDVSAWKNGQAPIGYGEPYLRTEAAAGPITTYFRTGFWHEGTLAGLTGRVMYDDGFVVYLNGQEIGRASMPAGPPTGATLALGHEASGYQTFDWSQAASLVVPGHNTVAVEVHQASSSSSDLVFDLELDVLPAWRHMPIMTTTALNGVWFVDRLRGFLVGNDGAIIMTDNGGLGWVMPPKKTTQHLQGIQFVDAQRGWIVGGGGTIFVTANSGSTWNPQSAATTADLHGLSFIDASTGWIIGRSAAGAEVHRTVDGGTTWTRLAAPAPAVLEDVAFVDALNGWVVGSTSVDGDTRGAIWRSSDGGATWTAQWVAPNHFMHLFDVEPLSATTAWAVGQSSTSGAGEIKLVTRDGGTTWESTPPASETPGSASSGMLAIDFVDASHGWAAGSWGTIIRTTDGGATWTLQDKGRWIDDKPWYRDLHMVDRMHGWAVGEFPGWSLGGVRHTTTGGE